MKVNKLVGIFVALAIIGLSLGDALTGHGMKGNGSLNPVALGINVVCKCGEKPGCLADNTGAVCAGGDNILCANWNSNCGGSTTTGGGDVSNPGGGDVSNPGGNDEDEPECTGCPTVSCSEGGCGAIKCAVKVGILESGVEVQSGYFACCYFVFFEGRKVGTGASSHPNCCCDGGTGTGN